MRFSKLIGKPSIFNEENEDYALNRCREIWVRKYPNEPFDNEEDSNQKDDIICNEDLLAEVSKQRCLYARFCEPYMSELVYLIAAKRRFKGLLYMMQRFSDGCCRLVPTTDILLMLMTHQVTALSIVFPAICNFMRTRYMILLAFNKGFDHAISKV